MLNCQHQSLRTNAAERGLVLDSARGSITIGTRNGWELHTLHVRFEVRLKSGHPSSDDVHYIVDRMEQCPVSINLKDVPDSRTTVDFF